MNYLFLFDKGFMTLFPLLDFEEYVWKQHNTTVLWETDNQLPNNSIACYVDKDEQDITDYYNLLINKTEELMSSKVDNTKTH
tara:strand:+ start:1829 stop:2074 length:246 start_codon:yes stop_codon:yes gene_type:complete